MKLKSFHSAALLTLILASLSASSSHSDEFSAAAVHLRPPAVPLVAHDPYFSIWSCADRLTDDVTRHWTGAAHPLVGLVRVDGQSFRLMGGGKEDQTPAMPQDSVEVQPTRTIYHFGNAQVRITFTFLTPALPEDPDVLSRPLTYAVWSVTPADGKSHQISFYLSAGTEIAVSEPGQLVDWQRSAVGRLLVLSAGSHEQPVLAKKGDRTRIDWGNFYLAADAATAKGALGSDAACRTAFLRDGSLPVTDDVQMPRAANEDPPVLALAFDLGTITEVTSRHALLAYDEIFAVNYFGQKLRPYWRRGGMDATGLLEAAERDYPTLQARCLTFDHDLMADLRKVGGPRYAALCALAYRQTLAGCGLAADSNGQPLLFPKENTSNGCIGTVDVIYPMLPQFLFFNPTLARAALVPVLDYAASPRWKFPFAPHDLGTYPQATGQVYGGGEKPGPSGREGDKMPVEESGNMLLLVAAVAKIDGNADFAAPWWPLLTRWAEYLESKGFDPENQLCTDDFAGHLAHNANLSIKAISALGAYGFLADMRGEKAVAEKYGTLARTLAAKWAEAANDGDHYRIAFDQPGTWSQKYNMIWDRLLDTNVFPPEIARKETAFYRTKFKQYGLPLDSRTTYVELPWSFWTASLTGEEADFQAILDPIFDYANRTSSRVPFADFYWTQDAKEAGMHARPVIGGIFMKALLDEDLWEKWAERDKSKPGAWATMPEPPEYTIQLPEVRTEGGE